MGLTIFYRGFIADVARVEDFEDRVLDLALETGAQAQIWRSTCDRDPRRVVRGLILDLYPGQETTSLLISPEGWLINLFEIEAAEKGQLDEPPWCFVKTQFGPVEGHVALVELLVALKKEFLPNLEVRDEGSYWESRDLETLRRTFARVGAMIDGLAEGLRRYGMSADAAEDPEIVAARIERVARLVHRTISRPPEHPPVLLGEDDSTFEEGWSVSEAEADALYKENRRKQQGLHRSIEELMGRGEDAEEAFEAAMRQEGIIDLPEEPSVSQDTPEIEESWDAAGEFEQSREVEEDEPWKESLPAMARDEDAADDVFERHPLQQRAMDLMLQLHELSQTLEDRRSSHFDILERGAGEMLGGLAQALGTRDLGVDIGLDVVQLKRALRGAAFALGALFTLRAEGILDDTVFGQLRHKIQGLQGDILEELCRRREARHDD